MNLNILNSSSHNIIIYLNILTSFNFYSCINKPTRVNKLSSTCIDHCLVKNINSNNIHYFIIKSSIMNNFSCLINISDDNDQCTNLNNVNNNINSHSHNS